MTAPVPATTATAGGYAAAAPNAPGQARGDANTQVPVELTDEEKRTRQRLIDLIRSKNPYQLSRDGVLSLPGFGSEWRGRKVAARGLQSGARRERAKLVDHQTHD
jgi:hypothetical protein